MGRDRIEANSAIDRLENKIIELENKIKKLEEKQHIPPRTPCKGCSTDCKYWKSGDCS